MAARAWEAEGAGRCGRTRASLEQLRDDVRTDVAGAAGDHDGAAGGDGRHLATTWKEREAQTAVLLFWERCVRASSCEPTPNPPITYEVTVKP